jgi:multidrug efflux system membrane fusion protein
LTRRLHQSPYPIAFVLWTPRRRLLALAVILLASACSRQSAPPRTPRVPVVVEPAVQRSVPIELRSIANVEAIDTVAVRPQVGGEITAVHFRGGSEVKAQDLLFTIDPRPYQAALHQAEATLARDEANARTAQLEAQRAQTLFDQGILAREQYDALHNSAAALEAAVRADRASVEAASLNLAYCTIRSPIEGRTGALLVQRGNVVKAIDGGPLVVINRTDPVFVAFSVPDKRLPEIKAAQAGGRVRILAQIPGEELRPLEGELTFLDNAVDRGTGTVRLKGTFPNRERRLWPGQFVNVTLALALRPLALVVPTQAIQTGQAGTFVFVVRSDQTVEVRPVVASDEIDGHVIVEKGLAPGETVVVDGQLRLVPGALVEQKPAVTAPTPQTPGRSS